MELDFYRLVQMDTSIILVYPLGMTAPLELVEETVNKMGAAIIDEGDISVNRARELARIPVRNTTGYYKITSTNKKVWDILKNPIENDVIRVLGIFHSSPPDNLPENCITIDVGRSIHSKATARSVHAVSAMVRTKKFPPSSENIHLIYQAVVVLCYEALYDSEHKMFPADVVSAVPKFVAFKFMYEPPKALTDASVTSAVMRFVEDV